MNFKPEKRFTFSRDVEIMDRVANIKEIVKKLKIKYPEILSFCMFGSLTKGNAETDSDIDGFLFVDAEEIQKFGQEIEIGITQRKASSEPYAKIINIQGDRDHESIIRGTFKEEMNLNDDQVGDVRSMPISKKIIDDHVQKMQEHIILKETSKKPEIKLSAIYPSKNLYAMFFLETGSDIKKYRRHLINTLAEMKKGEEIWKLIIESVEFCENFPSEHTKRYPKTLKEAKNIY